MWIYKRVWDFAKHEYVDVWSVGFYHEGNFVDVSSFPEERLAREEVHYLNGGNRC